MPSGRFGVEGTLRMDSESESPRLSTMDGYREHYSAHARIPTRLLGRTRSGLTRRRDTGMIPRLPRDTVYGSAEANRQHAIRRRRWLLAIFGRMMARFYERHERHFSAGRLECT